MHDILVLIFSRFLIPGLAFSEVQKRPDAL